MASFALEFRRRHFHAEQEAKWGSAGRLLWRDSQTAIGSATRASRRTGLCALLLAAAILAVFDSEGLRSSAYDLAETGYARSLLSLAEEWDGAMQRAGAKKVGASVRELVGAAREARWSDIAGVVAAPVLALTGSSKRTAAESFTGTVPEAGKQDSGLGRVRFSHSEVGGE